MSVKTDITVGVRQGQCYTFKVLARLLKAGRFGTRVHAISLRSPDLVLRPV